MWFEVCFEGYRGGTSSVTKVVIPKSPTCPACLSSITIPNSSLFLHMMSMKSCVRFRAYSRAMRESVDCWPLVNIILKTHSGACLYTDNRFNQAWSGMGNLLLRLWCFGGAILHWKALFKCGLDLGEFRCGNRMVRVRALRVNACLASSQPSVVKTHSNSC